MTQEVSILFNPGYDPDSNSFLIDVVFITPGRRKAINTVAEACIPAVSEKTSIVSPKTKAKISKIYLGISKGSIKIKNT